MDISERRKKIDKVDRWRTKIGKVDLTLVALLKRRAHYALEIARLKKALGRPPYDPQRERKVFRNVTREKGGPLDPDALRRVFELIIAECRSIECRLMKTDGTQQSEVGRQHNPNRPERKKKKKAR